MNNVTVQLNTPINMYRGDTVTIPILLNKGTLLQHKGIRLLDNVFLYVGVTEPNYKFEDAIIRKKYTEKDMYYTYANYRYRYSDIPYYVPTNIYAENSVCKDKDGNVYASIMNNNGGHELGNTWYWIELNPMVDIVFIPEDTVNLLPGKYYIEAKLSGIQISSGGMLSGGSASSGVSTVITVIPKKLFYILD